MLSETKVTMLFTDKERQRKTIGVGLSQRDCSDYKITYKPLHSWLLKNNVKIKEFADRINVPHSNFIHWLESNDPHVSTLLKIIIGTGGELKLDDFIEKVNKKVKKMGNDE